MKEIMYEITLLKDTHFGKCGDKVLLVEKYFKEGGKHLSELENQFVEISSKEEWAKVEKKEVCLCEVYNKKIIKSSVIGYGRTLDVYVDFKNKKVVCNYSYACDCDEKKELEIKYCPLCGKDLNQ